MCNYGSCFISYGSPDLSFVKKLNTFLKNKKIRTWAWYERIYRGEWRPVIQKALDDHECIIIVVSRSSLQRSGVQDENRLALADDIRPYNKRIVPIVIGDISEIEEYCRDPESRELLHFVKRVNYIKVKTKPPNTFGKTFQTRLLNLLKRQSYKILVIGSISDKRCSVDDLQRLFIQTVATKIGKYLALNNGKPICISTRGGGIDPFVSRGFNDSAVIEDCHSRLWLYPAIREKGSYAGSIELYAGPYRQVEVPLISELVLSNYDIPIDAREKILISRLVSDADCIIAIKGGTVTEHAVLLGIAQRKHLVFAPNLGGASGVCYSLYKELPFVNAPEACLDGEIQWHDLVNAEEMALRIVQRAMDAC